MCPESMHTHAHTQTFFALLALPLLSLPSSSYPSSSPSLLLPFLLLLTSHGLHEQCPCPCGRTRVCPG